MLAADQLLIAAADLRQKKPALSQLTAGQLDKANGLHPSIHAILSLTSAIAEMLYIMSSETAHHTLPVLQQAAVQQAARSTTRFGCTTKVLAKRMLKYYRIS